MLYDYAKGNEETFKMLIEFLKVYKKWKNILSYLG
jgi:hypothetical protein